MTTTKLKTIEMWLAKGLAALLTGAYLTGLIPTSGTAAEIAGVAATMLGYLGFAVVRSKPQPTLLSGQVLDTTNKQSGRVSMTLVAILAFLAVAACSLSMSCTAAQKKAVSDFGHCEETAAVKDLEGPIKSIGDQFIAGKLTKDSAMALLDSFGVSYGLDTVGCAVTFVEQAFGAKVSGSADTGAATDLYNEWLAKYRQASVAPKYREVTITDGSAANLDVWTESTGLGAATSGVITGSPAVVECPVDNMPGSPPSSDIPCNATITPAERSTLGSTFYGFEPQETEVTADGHVYIWHFGSDGVATYTEATPTVKP